MKFEKIYKIFNWGSVGVFLTIIFGLSGLYTYVHKPAPNILLEIINESNVFDLYKEVKDLNILFKNEDIKDKNLNLKVINVRIKNIGDKDILQNSFDKSMNWGIVVNNGRIIKISNEITTISKYLKEKLLPKKKSENKIEFEKVIFEKGKSFSFEILILHNREEKPNIEFYGKIAGIDKVSPVNTWEEMQSPRFLRNFFEGGFLLNLARFIFYVFILILLFFSIAITGDFLDKINKIRTKKRKTKTIKHLFGEKEKNKNTELCIEIYEKLEEKEFIDFFNILKNKEEITQRLNEDRAWAEYNSLICEYRKSLKHIIEPYIDDVDVYFSGREYRPLPRAFSTTAKKKNGIEWPKRFPSIETYIETLITLNLIELRDNTAVVNLEIMHTIKTIALTISEEVDIST